MLAKLLSGLFSRVKSGVFWEDGSSDEPVLLSVCIPTFERSALLRGTLEHLAMNGAANWEVVVSDNASSDRTEDTVKSFAGRFRRLRYVRHTVNRGPAAN